MRLRLWVRTSADRLPWREVLRPGRGIAYDLLARQAPELGARLHDRGWGPYGMAPFGYGFPVFPGARRRRGVYAVGGEGVVEFVTPLGDVAQAWAKGLAETSVLDWGGAAFRLRRVELVEPPEFESGAATFRSSTPVVMKGSGRDDAGVRTTRQAWLLPTDGEFPFYFEQNLRRKAEALGTDPGVTLERITWVGAKRSFAVSEGLKVGAPAEVELRGAPETLRAIWSWGLGQATSAGFGCVAA